MLLLTEKKKKKFEEKWKKWQPEVRLVTLHSHYRSIIQPLTKFIDTVQYKASESNYRVTVVIPQFIPKKGWHNILHNQSSLLIRAYLLYKRNVVITTVPYHLKKIRRFLKDSFVKMKLSFFVYMLCIIAYGFKNYINIILSVICK